MTRGRCGSLILHRMNLSFTTPRRFNPAHRELTMAESKQIVFGFRELAETLVKKEGIHEGHWGIFVRFGIQGANVGHGASDLLPAAIVPILEIGIQRFDEKN